MILKPRRHWPGAPVGFIVVLCNAKAMKIGAQSEAHYLISKQHIFLQKSMLFTQLLPFYLPSS